MIIYIDKVAEEEEESKCIPDPLGLVDVDLTEIQAAYLTGTASSCVDGMRLERKHSREALTKYLLWQES